jgi:heavy metal sensor kinase
VRGYDDPLDSDALTRDQESFASVWTQGYHLRVFTKRLVTDDGQLLGYLQAAADLRQVDAARNILLVVLMVGGVLAILLAALIGWFSARRALKPLNVITQTALQITRADDLSRRIPVPPGPHDEVGRLAMAFNESLERLEKLFNAQRRFLADVSHELRTPLTAIRGNVDLLRRMGGADLTSLDAIQTEAERMSRLVGDLLLLAQAESGNLPWVSQPVELDTLLLEVFREAQVLSTGVQVAIGEIDQAQVMGDRDRLKQLILNLVSNALKYTPEGGRVTLGLGRASGNWARLTVSDTGVGIPPDELPHIFERFYRVDRSRARAEGGTGLGLAIVKQLVEAHGGQIWAKSEPGSGTQVIFTLPL